MAALVESKDPTSSMSLLSSGTDFFSMLGMSEALPAPLLATTPPPKPTTPSTPRPKVLLDAPLPTSTSLLPPIQTQGLPAILPSTIGCSMGSNTKTVVVAGNFEGDASRLDVVMNKSRPLALKAAKRGNRVMYAFMGNCTPDVHRPGNKVNAVDSFGRIMELYENGIRLSDHHKVSPDDVILLAGPREIGWLRLANPNSNTREITRFDDPIAKEILRRPGILSDTKATRRSSLNTYNASMKIFEGIEDPDTIAVAMMLKLVLMTSLTMRAAGLATIFVNRLKHSSSMVDEPSVASLEKFLANFQGSFEDNVIKLIDGNELTPEGIGVMPASKALVDSVLSFAETVAARYTRHSKLVHCVVNGDASNGDGGLWLNPRGSDYRVGMLPVGVDETGVKVEWKPGPQGKIEWSKALNKDFRHFVKDFLKGDNSMSLHLYKAFVAMSLESAPEPLPFKDLGAASSSTCSGITSNNSSPFGAIQRRILVKEGDTQAHSELVRVMDQWANINTDAYTPSTYWAIATWCGSTKADLTPSPLALNLSEKLEQHLRNVSVTLASLLTARVRDRTVHEHGIAGLDGVLGPVVVQQKQQMRVIGFTHEQLDTAFVVFLPEAFVRWSLDVYNHDLDHAVDYASPLLATEGFLALPDEALVPLGFPGLPEAELEALRSELGSRVWALPKKRSNKTVSSFTAAEYASISNMLQPSTNNTTTPGFSLFNTRQTSEDSLAGVRVGLSPVPGMANRMTISPDMTDLHDLFRVVAQRIE